MKSEYRYWVAGLLLACANILAGVYDGKLLDVVIGADITVAALLLEVKWPGGTSG